MKYVQLMFEDNIHAALAIKAKANGRSLKNYCEQTVLATLPVPEGPLTPLAMAKKELQEARRLQGDYFREGDSRYIDMDTIIDTLQARVTSLS